jgi:cation diffusion facilitator family transporter
MELHQEHAIRPPENLERTAEARRSTLVSVAVNLVLSTVQILAGIFSASQALIADGVHSLSDLVADFVVLLANQQSKKEADEDHQYGHLRYENAASFLLGMLLLAVSVGMLWTAVVKIQNPADIPKVHITALWIALFALVAKEGLFRYMLAVAERIRSSMLIANAWHARSDAASSLVVAVGIVGNLLGYTLLDPIAAFVVGMMVGRMGWKFAWDALSDLMDRAVSPEEFAAIRATLKETPGVLGLHDMRTRKVGDLIIVDVHLELDGNLTVLQGHHIATEASARVLREHPVLNVMTHVDPVLNGVLIND